MSIYARHVRHRQFDRLRHSAKFLKFLATQASRLTGTSALEFTANATNDQVGFVATQPYQTGDGPFVVTTNGTLPAGLAADTEYWVRYISDTAFTLHPTKADAEANTNVVDITSAGTGTHFFNPSLKEGDIFNSLEAGKTAEQIKSFTSQDEL